MQPRLQAGRYHDVDLVLTTQEIITMIKEAEV